MVRLAKPPNKFLREIIQLIIAQNEATFTNRRARPAQTNSGTARVPESLREFAVVSG
jgi:hypothetical protein